MGYGKMISNIQKKYGVDSHEATVLKLMYISYKNFNPTKKRVTYDRIVEYYERKMKA